MIVRRAIAPVAILLTAIFSVACFSPEGVDSLYSNRILKAMKNMRVGDWVLYSVNKDLQVRMQVIERDAGSVTIEHLTYFESALRHDSSQHRFDFDEVERRLERGRDIYGTTRYLKMKLIKETVKVKGKEFEVEHWTMQTPGTYFEQWFSDEVSLWGIIQQRRNNRNTLLIQSWGRAGEKIINWPKNLPPITPSTMPLKKAIGAKL